MINPLEYLPLAEELMNSESNNEAKFRTSISRSYYAVFLHAGQKYLQFNNDDPYIESLTEHHANFIRELKNSTTLSFRKLGLQLQDLKQDREKADYRINEHINVHSATASYKKAIKIKDFTNEIFNN